MLIFAEKYDRNKEEKRKMKRIISILLYMAVLLPLAAQPPKHEVRAAWITAVYGLDWPQTRATSPEGIRKQQAELIEILDRLKAANFNTVLFQTPNQRILLFRFQQICIFLPVSGLQQMPVPVSQEDRYHE